MIECLSRKCWRLFHARKGMSAGMKGRWNDRARELGCFLTSARDASIQVGCMLASKCVGRRYPSKVGWKQNLRMYYSRNCAYFRKSVRISANKFGAGAERRCVCPKRCNVLRRDSKCPRPLWPSHSNQSDNKRGSVILSIIFNIAGNVSFRECWNRSSFAKQNS